MILENFIRPRRFMTNIRRGGSFGAMLEKPIPKSMTFQRDGLTFWNVVLDTKTKTNLIQWPIEETENLRSKKYDEFKDVELRPGSLVPLEIGTATQLDIVATFEIDQKMLESTLEADVLFNCTTSEGSVARGVLGPFGVVVLADAQRSEQLPVYFYIAKDIDGTSRTYFSADETRWTIR